jgi:hypothetical protein
MKLLELYGEKFNIVPKENKMLWNMIMTCQLPYFWD